MGCPCHLIHRPNTSANASNKFQNIAGFDMEDFCVDIFNWFDKSTNRKGLLANYCDFCDTEYKQIIKQANTRWLSLEAAVNRNLQIYSGLKSYFESQVTDAREGRFQRFHKHFEKAMTEIYLLFYQPIIPVFTPVNLLLQRKYPCAHILHDQIISFLRKFWENS